MYICISISLSLLCGLFKSHPHRPTVTCTVLACVDAVACGFFQWRAQHPHPEKVFPHFLVEQCLIHHTFSWYPTRETQVHHEKSSRRLTVFDGSVSHIPGFPRWIPSWTLGPRPFSEESVELFARAGEIKGQAMAKAVLAYQAHSTLGSKCNLKKAGKTTWTLLT